MAWHQLTPHTWYHIPTKMRTADNVKNKVIADIWHRLKQQTENWKTYLTTVGDIEPAQKILIIIAQQTLFSGTIKHLSQRRWLKIKHIISAQSVFRRIEKFRSRPYFKVAPTRQNESHQFIQKTTLYLEQLIQKRHCIYTMHTHFACIQDKELSNQFSTVIPHHWHTNNSLLIWISALSATKKELKNHIYLP